MFLFDSRCISLSPVSEFHVKSNFFSPPSSIFPSSFWRFSVHSSISPPSLSYLCRFFYLSIFSVGSDVDLLRWDYDEDQKRSDFFKGISFKWKQGSRQGWNSYKKRDQTVSIRTSLVCFLKNCLKLMSMVIYLMILRKVKPLQ